MAQSSHSFIARDYGLGGRGAHLVIPSVLGPILAALLVLNRVYWRITLIHQIGRDDICIILSLIFLFAHCIVNLVAVDHGYGREQAKLSPHDLYRALEMFYLDQIFYKFTINLTKLSILFLYLRIFSQRWFRRTCYGCVAIVGSYATASIIATIFQCTPVTHVFNKKLAGQCIDITAFWYANAIYNIVTDIVILASVPGVVWSLSLSTRQRIGLTLVFGLGIFVFATSILRMTTLAPASKAPDVTYGTLKSTMWTTIEASTAIVCACLPMMRTPIQKLFPKIFPTRYGSGSGVGNTADIENKGASHNVSADVVVVDHAGAGYSSHLETANPKHGVLQQFASNQFHDPKRSQPPFDADLEISPSEEMMKKKKNPHEHHNIYNHSPFKSSGTVTEKGNRTAAAAADVAATTTMMIMPTQRREASNTALPPTPPRSEGGHNGNDDHDAAAAAAATKSAKSVFLNLDEIREQHEAEKKKRNGGEDSQAYHSLRLWSPYGCDRSTRLRPSMKKDGTKMEKGKEKDGGRGNGFSSD